MTIVCDYLIVGSGAAPLAFLDTLLTELPDKKVVLVDKKAQPGGHWVDAYDFVHLHHSSVVYGIASKQLEGNWAKVLLTKCMLPWNHRASKREILDYFREFVDSKCQSGQLEYFPRCVYNFDQSDTKHVTFESLDGEESYTVEVHEKIVNGVRGECIIPSLTPPSFAVDQNINLMTPNQVFALWERESQPKEGYLSKVIPKFGRLDSTFKKDRHFVVLGAGKTGMDTVVFLQTALGVSPSDISWIIPNDVWMLSRQNGQGPFGYIKALLDASGDKEKAALAMEALGQFVRLDPNIVPTRFRFPVVGADEVKLMRNIDHKIRRGRVSSIRLDKNNSDITVAFEKDDRNEWVITKSNDKEYVFVHCTSPGPFTGKAPVGLFPSEREMTLDLLYAPPISISMGCLAKLEAARQQGSLDTGFGDIVLGNDGASANEILNELIQSLKYDPYPNGQGSNFLDEMSSTITQAIFIALVDKDPMVGYNWLKSNRLSMMSIPGFKGHVVEDLESIIAKGKVLSSDPKKLEMIRKVAEKLEPLRGK